jgi:hypothetical protein
MVKKQKQGSEGTATGHTGYTENSAKVEIFSQ